MLPTCVEKEQQQKRRLLQAKKEPTVGTGQCFSSAFFLTVTPNPEPLTPKP